MKKQIQNLIPVALLFIASVADCQVTFTGSRWHNDANAVDYIGGSPTPCEAPGVYYEGGSLTISNGTVLTDGGGQIGDYQDDLTPCPDTGLGSWTYYGIGNVIVDGPGSTWSNIELVYNKNGQITGGENGLYVGGGSPSTQGYLTIQNGGTVHAYGDCIIGPAATAPIDSSGPGSYGSVTINGQNSSWIISPEMVSGNNRAGLEIGDSGTSVGGGGWGQLIITNGGSLLSAGGCSVYSCLNGSCSLVVDGTGSLLNLPYNGFSISSRSSGVQGSIIVRNGGSICAGYSQIDCASVLVDGAGTTWSNINEGANNGIIVGENGDVGTVNMTIQNGGLVDNYGGAQVNNGDHLTVSGAGSLLHNRSQSGSLSLGSGYGPGASVVVENGGSIQCDEELYMNSGTSVTVAGADSSIVCSNYNSIQGTLMVLNGGAVSDAANPVGFNLSSPGLLGGNGILNGSVAVSAAVSAALAPGDGAGGIGTLTINGNLNWNGYSGNFDFAVAASSDQIVVSSNLYLSGNLYITTLPGVSAGVYTLFTYGGAFKMGTVNISGPPGFSCAIVTNTPGQVNLVLTSNVPKFTGASLSNGDLLLQGTSGYPNAKFFLIGSTNLTVPVAKWPIVATNQFDGTGNFVISNMVNSPIPESFYRIMIVR